jgi:hypothetical protein
MKCKIHNQNLLSISCNSKVYKISPLVSVRIQSSAVHSFLILLLGNPFNIIFLSTTTFSEILRLETRNIYIRF